MHGEYKVSGGKLIIIDLEADQDALVDVALSGGFLLDPDNALTRVAQVLEGVCVSASTKGIAKLVGASLGPDNILMGITPAAVGAAIRYTLRHALSWEDIDFEVIRGPAVDPVVNVALDGTLVRDIAAGRCRPFMRLWEWNSPQVVIGSFQSYQSEIQPEGVKRHDILVSRQVTSGGAMLMEFGSCIAYSLAIPAALVEGVSSEQSYPFPDQWIIEVLRKVGIKTKYVLLNDIVSEVNRIGGTAQKYRSNGCMARHVTIAYGVNAEKINEVLCTGVGKIRDKGMRNAVKHVDPMCLQAGLPREMILKTLYGHFTRKYRATPSKTTGADLAEAEEYCVTKSVTEE